MEIGASVRILHDHLAVDDGVPAGELGGRGDDRQIALRPVVAIPRESLGGGALYRKDRAVAVMFDLMDPALALGWRVYERRHHGDNEARRYERRTHNLNMEFSGCKGESFDTTSTADRERQANA